MKIKGFISVLAISVSILSFGQNTRGDIELGFNSGVNFSQIGNSTGNSDVSIRANFAASADYFFSNRWSIRSKLIYDQKGWDNGYREDSSLDPTLEGPYRTDFNLNYLTVPVVGSWHFGSKRNWNIHFGPYAGVLLNAKETTKDTNVAKTFNAFDFGLSLGIGVKIPLSEKFKFSIAYDEQSGLLDIFAKNPGSSISISRSSLNVGVTFMLK